MKTDLTQRFLQEIKKESTTPKIIQEQKTSDGGEFVEMVSILLHSRTQAHTFHLQTESYAEHIALQGYYDGIVGFTDTIVESYQGKYGIIRGYKSYPLSDYKSVEGTISFFQKLCDKVTSLRDCCDDSWLQNEIDNVCTLINQTLYKLKFLK